MADEKPVLGADDYAMLSDMLMSSDAAVRARGMDISKKLTTPEQQAFFDYQKSARPSNQTDEYARIDRNVLGWNGGGIDPEVAVAGGLGAARAFGGPAASTGLRLVQGAKNLVTQAAPLVKYEATKTLLQKMGVPESIATVSAAAVSGYKPGKIAGGTVAASTEVKAANELTEGPQAFRDLPLAEQMKHLPEDGPIPDTMRYASPPMREAPPSAPPKPVNATGTSFTPAPMPTGGIKPPPPVLDPEAQALRDQTATAASRVKLTSAETPIYMRLRAQGKTHTQAMEAIGAARSLASSSAFKNLPTSIDVAKAVGDRNAGGAW